MELQALMRRDYPAESGYADSTHCEATLAHGGTTGPGDFPLGRVPAETVALGLGSPTGRERHAAALSLGTEREFGQADAGAGREGRALRKPLPRPAQVRPASARVPGNQPRRDHPGDGTRRPGADRVHADDGVRRRGVRRAAVEAPLARRTLAHALVDAVLRRLFRTVALDDRLERVRGSRRPAARSGGAQGGHRSYPA